MIFGLRTETDVYFHHLTELRNTEVFCAELKLVLQLLDSSLSQDALSNVCYCFAVSVSISRIKIEGGKQGMEALQSLLLVCYYADLA